MAQHRTYLGRATIPNAGTESNVLGAKELSMCKAIEIQLPATMTGATVALHSGPQEDTPAGSMFAHIENGTAVSFTVATGRRQNKLVSGLQSLKLVSASSEGAARDIDVWAILDLR